MTRSAEINLGPSTTYYYFIDNMELTPTQRLLYMRVLNFTVAGKDFYQSFASLGKELGITERGVRKAMGVLLDKGYVKKCGGHKYRADLEAILEPENYNN